MPSGSAALLVLFGLGRLLDAEGSDRGMATIPVPAPDPVIAPVTSRHVVKPGHPALDGDPVLAVHPPQWIRHKIRPRERLSQIAARYGVRRSQLVEWNRIDGSKPYPPKSRRSLRVLAHRVPPPRQKVEHTAAADESWADIAAKYRVERRDLRAYNWQVRRLSPGRSLIVWIDPAFPLSVFQDTGPAIPAAFDVPGGGLSVGRPHRGRLENGVQLPKSDLYTRRSPSALWGSTHTVTTMQRAMSAFRHDTGYDGEIVIGSMSRRGGRRFRPHISHQSGRDIDIRLPRLPGIPNTTDPNPDEVDWYAAWALIRAFIDTGEVSVIFLEAHLQSRLYEAARVLGETPDDLKPLIAWPHWQNDPRPLVRHSDGHDGHIHVRIQCGAAEPRCRSR